MMSKLELESRTSSIRAGDHIDQLQLVVVDLAPPGEAESTSPHVEL
jgi:hypothetical protein